jgi:hypothetical protein
MRVHDVLAELELDVLDNAGRQVLQQLLFDDVRNGVLLGDVGRLSRPRVLGL